MEGLKTITILFKARDAFDKAIQRDVVRHGLNVTEYGILEALYHKGPMTIKLLLEKVLITNSSMSYVVEQLIKKEIVSKSQSDSDRRCFQLELTSKGKVLMTKAFKEHKQHMRNIVEVLSKAEEDELKRLLKKVGKAANDYGL